jgi:riboflavin kinase / FMN adenylyltransferase
LGHREIINTLCDTARKEGKESAIISFWPHPRTVLQQDAYCLRLLNSLDEKRELITSLGVDRFYVIPFTKELSTLSAREFMKKYLAEKYGVSTLIVGYDHRMGRDDDGSPANIMDIAKSVGINSVKVEQVLLGDKMVSSTKIRNIIVEGEVASAGQMLGYHYPLHGVVVMGNRLGRTMGFPTANMQLYEPLKVVPGNGVYKVEVEVLGVKKIGVCNVGNRPTVGADNSRTIETFILDFDEDIYGLDLTIRFVERIRSEKRFSSMDELKKQISLDELYARG